MSILYLILAIAVPSAIVAIALVYFGRRPRIELFPDGICVRYVYKAIIPSDSIASIRLIEERVSVKGSGNGFSGVKRLSGFYGHKEKGERGTRTCLFYLNNRHSAPVIEIASTYGYCFINLDTEEQTRELYDEMLRIVKFKPDAELQVSKHHKDAPKYFLRVMAVVAALTFVITICNIITVLPHGKISFTDDSIKISGSYGTEIYAKDITSVGLESDYPNLSRINGIATSHVRCGCFKSADGMKYSLYLFKFGSKPYVYINTDERRYLLNGFDGYANEDLLINIKKVVDNYEESN